MKNPCRTLTLLFITGMILGLAGCPTEDKGGGNGGGGNGGGYNGDNNNIGGTITHTVTYNALGALGTPPDGLTVSTDSYITLHDGSGFSKDGYIFDGWYTYISGTRTDYSAGSSYYVTENVYFYANWPLPAPLPLT